MREKTTWKKWEWYRKNGELQYSEVFEIKHSIGYNGNNAPPKKKKGAVVKKITPETQKRMRQYINTVDWGEKTYFMTLTTRGGERITINDFNQIARWIRKSFLYGVWARELHKSGTVHYHFILSGAGAPHFAVDLGYNKVQGQESERASFKRPFELLKKPYTNFEKLSVHWSAGDREIYWIGTDLEIVETDRVASYMSKYLSKGVSEFCELSPGEHKKWWGKIGEPPKCKLFETCDASEEYFKAKSDLRSYLREQIEKFPKETKDLAENLDLIMWRKRKYQIKLDKKKDTDV